MLSRFSLLLVSSADKLEYAAGYVRTATAVGTRIGTAAGRPARTDPQADLRTADPQGARPPLQMP